ncbi:cytoplasmic phosphatidylinositol transfer protein 1 [Leptopilina heterotoma]|uniref:cytoplasmic phosphatidylinositol transfer protein 1 n=1 Tax=Leptopilina heterotoma TaxID=63436 RepID=UPI001CA884DF|nr:cytoplasmic phosphatidylinositol transfer protein 1 [Leptopilina heterotoma]
MVLTKEYRICMPLTVEEYRIGQLYMIARHSHEQSDHDEGVEVVENCECEDPTHGKGRYTEKRIHLSSKLPYWIQSIIPRIFYVTEKAWNYYPFTITEYTCSFIPKFQIYIKTRYEDNNGSTENCLGLSPVELVHRELDFIDIAYDEITAKHYKEEEDPKFFQSKLTGRGPLIEGWKDTTQPIMCSYKVVNASFEVWGMQTRVEDFVQRCIRDILLLGHRQAFAWIDEWHDMTLQDVRKYEEKMQAETNEKVQAKIQGLEVKTEESIPPSPTSSIPSSPTCKSPTQASARSWFSWS